MCNYSQPKAQMERQFTQIKLILTSTFVLLIALNSFGQKDAYGKYARTEYPAGHLVLNSDKTFKFRFRFDSQWDLACGEFELKKDTIFFSYTSDMLDVNCNNERINMTDTSDYFLRTGIDKRWRPISAKITKGKIQTIQTGDVKDPETVSFNKNLYRKEKNRKPADRS